MTTRVRYDSKLIYGCKLGSYHEVVRRLGGLSLPGIDFMSAIEYYNEYLPDNIYMEVICADKFDVNNAEVHLTLIDDTDFSRLNGENMIESIRNANREGFGYVLAQLELPLTEPHFYTVYFTY